MQKSSGVSALCAILAVLSLSSTIGALNYDYYPTDEDVAATLKGLTLLPGDVITFHANSPSGSTYDLESAGSWTFDWNGSEDMPIIVRAAPGDKVILTNSNADTDVIRIKGSYFVFEGFDITGHPDAVGSIALRLYPDTDHVVVRNLKIYNIYQNAITANNAGGDYTNITLSGNEISQTAGTGECIYVGCQASSSTTTSCVFHDGHIVNNYCHDVCTGRGSTECPEGYGSGFQIKFGSYNNVIRNNVCYRTQGPCVLLYDDWNLGANLAEGNLIIGTTLDAGIQVSAGAVIRNNIILNSAGSGINIANNPNNLYDGQPTRRIYLHHNSVVNNGEFGIRFSLAPTDSEIINNVAVGNTAGSYRDVDMDGVPWRNNAYETGSETPTNVMSGGLIEVQSATDVLVNPTGYNVYPVTAGGLVGAGWNLGLAYDFNQEPRGACEPTIGAYEYSASSNPGWAPASAFKRLSGNTGPCSLAEDCTIACTPGAPETVGLPPGIGGSPLDGSSPPSSPVSPPPSDAPTGQGTHSFQFASAIAFIVVSMLLSTIF